MASIDLNADMGEYANQAERLTEAALTPLVTSCSIACGGHAGDEETMLITARRAKAHGLNVGAHPSYPDRENFGRRSLRIATTTLAHALGKQIAVLKQVLDAESISLSHLKPHGALYNDAAKSPVLARIIVKAAKNAGGNVVLFGPPHSALEREAAEAGVPFAAEGFVDRLYRQDGSLTPRSEPGAIIEEIAARAEQALAIARGEPVNAADGTLVVPAATLCIHSDSPGAVETAKAVREALDAAGVVIKAAP